MNIFLRFSALPALLFAATGAFAQTERLGIEHRTSVVRDSHRAVLPILVSAPKLLRVGQPSEFTLEVVNNKFSMLQNCEPVLQSEAGMPNEDPYDIDLSWQAHNDGTLGSKDEGFEMGGDTMKRVTLEVTPNQVPAPATVELVFGLQCQLVLTSTVDCEPEAENKNCLDIGMQDYNQVNGADTRGPLTAEDLAEEEETYGFTTAFSRAWVTIEPEYLLTLGSGDEDTLFIDPGTKEGFLDWAVSVPDDFAHEALRFSISHKSHAGIGVRACFYQGGCGTQRRLDKGAEATGWLTAFLLNDGAPNLDDISEHHFRLSAHGLDGSDSTPIAVRDIQLRTLPRYCAELQPAPQRNHPASDGLTNTISFDDGWVFFVEEQEDKPYIEGDYPTDFLTAAKRSLENAVMFYRDALEHRRSGTKVVRITDGSFEARVHPSASYFQVYLPSAPQGGAHSGFFSGEGNLKDRDGEWLEDLSLDLVPLDSAGQHVVRSTANFFTPGKLALTRSGSGDCE